MSDTTPKNLWTLRSPEETRAMYADWAETYEGEIAETYKTPERLSKALAGVIADKTRSVLDFGCGTGLSGMALAAEGFTTIDGTDITPEMLEKAREKPAYRTLWLSELGDVIPTDHYEIIAAIGVVSLGAAPPDTHDMLLSALPKGGIYAFSYNDPTLEDAAYMGKLKALTDAGTIKILLEDYGPHLLSKNMNSSVYIVEKTA